jgi:hypothetical protein
MISCNDDFLSWKVPQEACERCGLSFCSTDLMLSLSHSGSKPDHVRPLYLDKGLYYLRDLRDAYQRYPDPLRGVSLIARNGEVGSSARF